MASSESPDIEAHSREVKSLPMLQITAPQPSPQYRRIPESQRTRARALERDFFIGFFLSVWRAT